MISSSQQFLLQCLSDFLHARTGVVASQTEINWDEVFQMAVTHSIEGIIFRQCQNTIPVEIKKKYLRQYLGHAVLSFNREKIIKELTNRFEVCRIPTIYMKGSVFRDYYPIPPLRSMGDIDLIIQPSDREKTDHILQKEMGFQRFIENHAVWTYWKDSIFIEVHDHMFYENLANRIDYRAYFDNIWEHCHNAQVFGIESSNQYVPDEEFHFLYLMTHTAKHIINNGSGFRAFLDMVFMTKQCDLDWDWLKTELERLELLDFTKTCFALCERWFDVEMPFGNKSLDESFFQEITEKTFRDGVFGLENRQNAGAHTAKEIKRGEGSYISGALTLTIKKLFPSYRDMQLIPWYSWVDKKPWLMPAAWVYRWIYCIKNKRRAGMDLLMEPFSLRDTVEKREALIRSWGL